MTRELPAGMTGLDELEILVVVDNETDTLSSVDEGVPQVPELAHRAARTPASGHYQGHEAFQVSVNETECRILYELGDGLWDIPELRRFLNELLPLNNNLEAFEMEHNFAHIGPRTMVLKARRIDNVQLIPLAIEISAAVEARCEWRHSCGTCVSIGQ